MKTVLKISTIILTTALATGCTNTAEINNLQQQIDELNVRISALSSDSANANASAADAASRAAAAEAAANRSARYAQDTNNKLDRMFKKSMMK